MVFQGKYWVKNVVLDEKRLKNIPIGNYNGRLTLLERGKPLAAIEVNSSIKL